MGEEDGLQFLVDTTATITSNPVLVSLQIYSGAKYHHRIAVQVRLGERHHSRVSLLRRTREIKISSRVLLVGFKRIDRVGQVVTYSKTSEKTTKQRSR